MEFFGGDKGAGDVRGEGDPGFEPAVSVRGLVVAPQPGGRHGHVAREGEEERGFPRSVTFHVFFAGVGPAFIGIAKSEERTGDIVGESSRDSGLQERHGKAGRDQGGLVYSCYTAEPFQ
ncbi:hypothetical protein [Microbacterium sp. W4I20]|uniref:hypothetical protein n=1 Tax=Microbacterium sp. W4I20 TaxID=3042262 RepID=UPI0027D7CC6A|nr:hypothetical protein [Microbacterium sp. W4I20]